MSKIIGQFGGKVIKNIGDCLLYYYFRTQKIFRIIFSQDVLIVNLRLLDAQPIISEYLSLQGLPAINYRISADYGYVVTMNASNSESIDMIGPPVNMVAKINHFAEQNEFVIGGDFHEIAKKIADYSFKQVPSCNIWTEMLVPSLQGKSTLVCF